MNALVTGVPHIAQAPLKPLLRRQPGFRYFLQPARRPATASLLVAVHGISRNSHAMVRWLGDYADRHNFALLVPHFDKTVYGDYQRLGRCGRGRRADQALLAMLADAEPVLGAAVCRRFALFGFSGGAQFAHRFAYAYGNRLQCLVCAAAGWYTAPDPAVGYPYGLGATRRLPGLAFDAAALLRIPSLTLVGALDCRRDPALRQNPRLDGQQGKNRYCRARWWHHTLQTRAREAHLHEFQELPGTGHDFVDAMLHGGLGERLFAFVDRYRWPPSR